MPLSFFWGKGEGIITTVLSLIRSGEDRDPAHTRILPVNLYFLLLLSTTFVYTLYPTRGAFRGQKWLEYKPKVKQNEG